MKKSILTLVVMCLFLAATAQVDTIYKRNNQKVPCKILEINDYEIKYRMVGLEDGPLVIIDKSTVLRYRLSNGFIEVIRPDELSLENEHIEIIGNRTVIKIHPFSWVNHKVSFAFEKVIKVGMNLDVEFGYSNSAISQNSYINGSRQSPNTGAYIKPGLKFFLGQDFSVRGLKYAHPLKGRYVKLDLAISYLNYQNLNSYSYLYSNGNTYYYDHIQRNMNVASFGGFVNFGRQFILGNTFTLDYYFGAGFTSVSYSYSNVKNETTNLIAGNYGSVRDGNSVYDYHGFLRIPGIGFSLTGGFRIGYIIPSKPANGRVNKVSTTAN